MNFDPLQKAFVNEFKKDRFLREYFYFTGGTALSVFYFGHRKSEDLDFFTEKEVPKRSVLDFLTKTADKLRYTFEIRQQPEQFDIMVVNISFKNKKSLKVDFNNYPHKKVDKEKVIDGLRVDSLLDIGANKFLTINQRNQVKDYVDLYFLMQKFSLWDLIYAVETKFHMGTEPLLLALDFQKAEEFTTLPHMYIPFSLSQLKSFYRKQVKHLKDKVLAKN